MESSPAAEKLAGDGIRLIHPVQHAILYVSVCLGMFLSLLDTSIVATALFTIGEDFGDSERINWVALAYTLSYLGCSVTFASISDVVGRRVAYSAAFVMFIAFSIGCGCSTSLNMLIAFRALQGVGGAGLYSLTMIIFPEVTSAEKMALIGSITGAVVTLSGILGPVLGGVITHNAVWRWVFWINGPIGAVALVLFLATWPAPDQLRSPPRRAWREVDVLGSVLLVAATVLVVYAFQNAGFSRGSWSTAGFLAPLCTGILAWGLLFAWARIVHVRYRTRIASVLPLHLLSQRVYAAIVIYTLFMGFPYFQLIYALPLRFQVVNGTDALHAGLWLLPTLGAAALGSMIAGFVNLKRNNITATLICAGALSALGTGLLSTLSNANNVEAKAFGFQVLVGMGFGLAVATGSLATLLESSLADTAVAQGIVAQARVFGGSLGIASSTSILGTIQTRELAGLGISREQLDNLRESIMTLKPQQIVAVVQSYVDSFQESMWVSAGISALMVLAAAATYRKFNEPPMELRNRVVGEEMARRKALAAARAGEQNDEASADRRMSASTGEGDTQKTVVSPEKAV